MGESLFDKNDVDSVIVESILKYANLVSRKGFVYNQLGNIAIRTPHSYDPKHGVVYTKHKGISLEEITKENIIITDIPQKKLLFGKTAPSIGHKLNTTLFLLRPDVNAVVHLHINEIIAYFSVFKNKKFQYISIDSPIILGRPPFVFDLGINVESNPELLKDFINKTDCFIMPNHGVTTFGENLSIAYNRLSTIVAEIRRLKEALWLSNLTGNNLNYLQEEEEKSLYELSKEIL